MAGAFPVFCAFDEIVELENIRPNPKNPNRHPQEQIDLLVEVIRHRGWRAPVTVSTLSGLIVRGHARFTAARQLGCPVPVDYQDYPSEAEELADLVADNRLAELADLDEKALADIFSDLDTAGLDLALAGYQADAVAELRLNIEEKTIDMDKADELPDMPIETYTMPGDVWTLGKHRLICGDSTKPETYSALMQGELAQLIVTDPPYNVDYEGTAGKIMNDSMSSDKFRAFLHDMYSATAAVTAEGAAAYIFHADSEGVAFREEFQRAGFLCKQCLVWVKNVFVLGRQDYQWRHEPILYGWKAGAAHYFAGRRDISTVIDESGRPDVAGMSREEMAELISLIYDEVDAIDTTILYCDKPLKNADHPTMKPVALVARLIENSSKAGWIVLDPFGGSGSTLIAAEAMGRAARIIELDPKFCDVIVRRYAASTGKNDITLLRSGTVIPGDQVDILQ